MARTSATESKSHTPTPAAAGGDRTVHLRGKKHSAGQRRSKSQQRDTPPAWSKSTPVSLKDNASVDDVIAVVVSACRDHWRKNLAAAVDGRNPEGLHQVRVSLRRLRSALSAFKTFIPVQQRDALRTEAKWLLTELGTARDLDVFVQELAKPLAERLSEDAGLAQLMRAARLAQNKAHSAAGKALQSARARRFAARLDAWVSGRGWRTGDDETENSKTTVAADFARRFLNRRLRKIRDTYADVESLSVDARHELRIAVKKTRYAIEFFHTLLPGKRAVRLNGVLKDLQDNLGHLNDLDVAERTVGVLVNEASSGVERRQIAAGGNAIGAWHKHAAADAEPDTVKLWRKLKKASAF